MLFRSALAAFRMGQVEAARKSIERALETFDAEGNQVWVGETLLGLATLWSREGNTRAAAALIAAATLARAQYPAPPHVPFTPSHGIDPNELPVEVTNKSGPVLCAEKDNVHLDFASPAVRKMRVQAVPPAYIGTIVTDRWAPDWTACDMTRDPNFRADNARRITFWETPDFWLTGYTFPSFWRPNTVPVRVGQRVEQGLHLVQFWMRFRERAEEVLVFYPPDGYWRARPLPFGDLRWTAYGSSFLVGPIEIEGRPFVDIKDIEFDPATRTLKTNFVRGGSASVRLDKLDQERIVLDVTLSAPITEKDRPFAGLRSMYVSEGNSDVSRLAWRKKDGKTFTQFPIMNFMRATASEVWAGRTLPSKHNTSAPDMVFRDFSSAAR